MTGAYWSNSRIKKKKLHQQRDHGFMSSSLACIEYFAMSYVFLLRTLHRNNDFLIPSVFIIIIIIYLHSRTYNEIYGTT